MRQYVKQFLSFSNEYVVWTMEHPLSKEITGEEGEGEDQFISTKFYSSADQWIFYVLQV